MGIPARDLVSPDFEKRPAVRPLTVSRYLFGTDFEEETCIDTFRYMR